MTIDYSEITSKDPNFYLRMGLRPDLHEKIYPGIPNQYFSEAKTILEKKAKDEPIIPKGNSKCGKDSYKEIRKIMDPMLHMEYYPDETWF